MTSSRGSVNTLCSTGYNVQQLEAMRSNESVALSAKWSRIRLASRVLYVAGVPVFIGGLITLLCVNSGLDATDRRLTALKVRVTGNSLP